MIQWSFILVLVALGLIGLLTLGTLFLPLGFAIVVLASHRARPDVFWPGVAAVVLAILGYLLVAPLGCTATAVSLGQSAQSHTTCSSVLGLDYSGTGDYNPSLWPAVIAGFLSGAVGGAMTWLLVRRKPRSLAAS